MSLSTLMLLSGRNTAIPKTAFFGKCAVVKVPELEGTMLGCIFCFAGIK
jgi:hypothetical protein